MKQIAGAGLAGLIAGHAFPRATLFEAAPAPTATHRAVLRFRTDAVARLTGIEFRQVLVRKGIFSRGKFVDPNIALANLYARKVTGYDRLVGDRSIWKLDPVQRFIAPDDLHERLVSQLRDRIEYGQPFDYVRNTEPVVSTAPMPVVLKALSLDAPAEFFRAGITVQRWKLPKTDVFQTVYFPDDDTQLMRASITGDLLIAEYADCKSSLLDDTDLLESAFGICLTTAQDLGNVEQKYGKIVNIPDDVRKRQLFELTHHHKVYSLGRFATWRNVLLDDVVEDCGVIKRLLNSSAYDLRHAAQ